MARPSEQEIEKALARLHRLAVENGSGTAMGALVVVHEASRSMLPTNEAAAILGVEPGNMRPDSVRGLPEPAVVWPRPTVNDSDRVMRWWFEDEIRECAAGRRPRRKREDGAA